MSKQPDLFSKTVKRGPSLAELAKAVGHNPFEPKRREDKPAPQTEIPPPARADGTSPPVPTRST